MQDYVGCKAEARCRVSQTLRHQDHNKQKGICNTAEYISTEG